VLIGNQATVDGGGILAFDSSIDIIDCTIARTESPALSSAIALQLTSTLYLSGSIVAEGLGGSAVGCSPHGAITIYCTDLWNNAGGDWTTCIASFEGTDGNFSADPILCDPLGNDVRLRSDSPCVDAPGCGLLGGIGVGCTPSAIEATSWGAIKARYRSETPGERSGTHPERSEKRLRTEAPPRLEREE
jgi:hypothetical protein